MVEEKQIKKLKEVFKKENVEVAYIFGSRARGEVGPLSDIDIAVSTKRKNLKNKADFISKVGKALGINDFDVVFIKEASPKMKFNIIKDGKNIYSKNESVRINLEKKIMSQYLDMKPFLDKYAEESLKRKAKT